jgi:hypothetical protein
MGFLKRCGEHIKKEMTPLEKNYNERVNTTCAGR